MHANRKQEVPGETKKPATIDEYIASFTGEVRTRLTQIREVFKTTYPNVTETIRYGMPAFKVGKEHLYISGYKNHIGMYPLYGLPQLENKLAVYRGKGTKDALHFPHALPLPLELIKKIVLEKSSAENDSELPAK